jgi:cytoskeletal protein RodZ
MSNLGSNFKKARESLGIPIEKIAAETRISVRFLTAIENEEFRVLPGGIFNRGFIRAYAEHVGLNPDAVLADYDRMGLTPEEPVEALRTVERESRKNTERHLYPVAAVLLAVLIIGYYVATRGGPVEEAQTAEVQDSRPAEAAPAPETKKETPAIVAEPAPPTTPATTPPPAATAAVPPAPQPTTGNSSSPSAPPLVLDVDITALSWIKVIADGTITLNGELPAGTSRRFTANNSIVLSVGNAGGTNVRINGRDPGPLGPSGSVRPSIRFTPENSASIRFQ